MIRGKSMLVLSFIKDLFFKRFLLRFSARIVIAATILFLSCPGLVEESSAWPLRGTDSLGVSYDIGQRPERVVSLVPEITEILIAIDATDALVGITKHTVAPEVSQLKRVGGFLAPNIEQIEALEPDLILAADLHKKVRDHFRGKVPVLTLNVFSIKEAMERLALLGRIFDREELVTGIIAKNQEQLDKVAQKVAGIPGEKKKRVVRLMGHATLLVPGDNSFQNDFIRAAGAIPPRFGKKGQAVTITPEQWLRFDPQVVYFCGSSEVPAILSADKVKEVRAVQNNKLYSFSCDLTCRAGVNIGNFVTLLTSRIYGEEISGLSPQEQPGKPTACVSDEQ
jgi:iron complex transport system substrate-binding protein